MSKFCRKSAPESCWSPLPSIFPTAQSHNSLVFKPSDLQGLLPLQSLCHSWFIWGQFLRTALIPSWTAYSSWVRLVISILVKTSATCSQFYTPFLLKRENDNEAAYLFQTFLLEAWIHSNFFVHTPKLLSRKKSVQKTLPFGFSESHITSVSIAVCSFLTPPLPPNKNQPLAQLNPYSSASVWHLTWTAFSQTSQLLQLLYFKKELLFIISWLKGSHSTISHKNVPCLYIPLQMSDWSETNKTIFHWSFS